MTELEKLAKKKKDERTFPISRALKNEKFRGALSAIVGGTTGAAAGGIVGGTKGALIGGSGAALATALRNAISSRATLGRSRTKQKGIGESERKILKALRADKKNRKGSTRPISRALTSVPGAAALGATPGLALTALVLSKGKQKNLAKELLAAGGLTAGGAGAAGGLTALGRVINARGHRGEARVGRKKSYSQGLFEGDTAQTKILKALKKAKD